MGARFTLTLVVVMAAGLSGCFESQRDETFEDTVVLDDVDVRVLNAMADAPRLTLDVNDEARVEALAFGQAEDFSLPANQYRFRVRGDTGEQRLATLFEGAQDNLEEGQRHDLILAGSLSNDSRQIVVFKEDDETFEGETQEDRDEEEQEEEEQENEGEEGEPDSETDETSEAEEDERPLEQVRLRGAHLTQGAGNVDLYLDQGVGEALGEDREPEATLGFGDRSEPLLVEEGVYRVRLTEAGNAQNVIYDSGARLDFEFDQDLLLGVVPNTGIDNASYPVSLVIVDETETRAFPHKDQRGGLQFVHATGGEGAVAVSVNGSEVWNSVSFAATEPGTGPLDYRLSDAGEYDLIVDNSEASTIARANLRLDRGRGTSALLVENGDAESDRGLVVLNNDDRSVVTNARVRLVHAANAVTQPVDIYRVEAGGSLSSDGTVQEPLVSGLNYRGRSGELPVPESTSHELLVTPAGTPGTILLRAPVTLEKGGNYRLIVAGDGNTDDVRLIRLGGVR